ncbi:MAG: hypothetical protein EXS22_04835 [Pedosphaera sp.]|nr:hypothetical protein [Pedosphaera sp.]MSU43352.1 hypothetical protein [Pedosphaera sp.]
MAIARVLVDGYNLLHVWQDLAPGHPRHSTAAREALIRKLTHYTDAKGVPVTIIFDGYGRRSAALAEISPPGIEVLYSGKGHSADSVIERVAHRLRALGLGEALAVTDDNAQRDTVIALGGFAQCCTEFIAEVESTLGIFERELRDHNRREGSRYRR